jgi:fluoroquinolone transport system permease protein
MRLLAAIKTDVLLQARNQLVAISVGVAILVGGALAWLASPGNVHETFPFAMLMFVGGSTLLYVVAMIILEREDGTLDAVSVSPLRPWEYLASKVITLTALATLEGALITGAALAFLARGGAVPLPSALLLVGLGALGVMLVLMGIILVVRHQRLSTVILPMSLLALVLQVPAFYFFAGLDYLPMLAIPSGAPGMLLRGAFVPLATWEWVYGLGGTALMLALLIPWSLRAYDVYVIGRTG